MNRLAVVVAVVVDPDDDTDRSGPEEKEEESSPIDWLRTDECEVVVVDVVECNKDGALDDEYLLNSSSLTA